MRNDLRRATLPFLALTLLAACNAGDPAGASNAAVPAETNDSTAPEAAAEAPANVTEPVNQAEAAPGAASLDFAAIAGRWKVVGVQPGDGVQALLKDDPAYMGRIVQVSGDRLAWDKGAENVSATVSDVCTGPATEPLAGTAATTQQKDHAGQLKALGLPVDAPVHAIECNDGNWGPEAAGGAIFFGTGPQALAMTWYDGVVLKLAPAGK